MLKNFKRVKKNPNAFVVVMTGREDYFRDRIEQLLENAGLKPHKVYLQEKQMGTINSKMKNIIQLISNPEESDGNIQPGTIRKVTLYEDRDNHAERFKKNLILLNNQVFGNTNKTMEKRITGMENNDQIAPRWLKFLDRASIPIEGLAFDFSIVMPLKGERIVKYLPIDIENHLLYILLHAKDEESKPKYDSGVKDFTTSTKLIAPDREVCSCQRDKQGEVTRKNIRILLRNMSRMLHPNIEWNMHGSSTSNDIDVIVPVRGKKLAFMSVDAMRKLEDRYRIAIQKILENEDPRPVDVNLVELSPAGTIIACSKGTPSKTNNALFATYNLHCDKQRHPCFVKQRCVRNIFKDSLASSHYIVTGLARTATGCKNCTTAEGLILGCSACNMYPEIKRKARFSVVEMLQYFLKFDMTAFVFFNNSRVRVCDILKSVVFQLCQSISFMDCGAELFTKEAAIDAYPQMAPFIRRQVYDTSDKQLFYQLNVLKDSFCERLLHFLQQNDLKNLPAYAFELSEKHLSDIDMVLREGYDIYLENRCSERTREVVLRSPYKYTDAKKQMKYLLNNKIKCMTIHTMLSGRSVESKIVIPLEDKAEQFFDI